MSAKEFLERFDPKTFSMEIEERDGELYVILPPELMEETGWTVDTQLKWVIEDGQVFIKEVKDE